MGVTYKEDKPRVQESIKKLVEDGLYTSPLSLINQIQSYHWIWARLP